MSDMDDIKGPSVNDKNPVSFLKKKRTILLVKYFEIYKVVTSLIH